MEGFAVSVRFPVLWGDMDSLGHVNNARYFTWFESARIEYLRALGLETEGAPEYGPILAHTSCDFLAPVVWPAEVEVGARAPRIGKTSFEMEYRAVLCGAEQEVVARGKGVVVMFNYATGQKVAVSDALRARIQELG